MAEDWLADVRKYAADAEASVVGAIVKHLGIALRSRDSSLVAFSDPKELARVRDGFMRRKLALTGTDTALNEGLDWVKGLMSGDRTKNRVTVYYLLAHYFGKLDLFGGPAGTSAASLGSAAAGQAEASLAGRAATSEGVPTELGTRSVSSGPPVGMPDQPTAPSQVSRADEPVPARPIPSAPLGVVGDNWRSDASGAQQPSRSANVSHDRTGGSGWPTWLTWLLIALAVIALFVLWRRYS